MAHRGDPGGRACCGFLAWLVASIFRVWKSGEPEAAILDLALAQAASISIVLLLLHSVIDFPLRIAAVTVLFAIACAYLIPGRKIEPQWVSFSHVVVESVCIRICPYM